jgi:hypothetical protein
MSVGQETYRLNPGLPEDFVDLWFAQNWDSDLIRNKLILKQSTEQRALDEAKECEKSISGLAALLQRGLKQVSRTQ